ncbi:MAG: NAD-dependent epimerase/dehydratase family protein [Actinomycetota bacterium]
MARVLVTGITGYVGQHCGAELLSRGHEVVGTIRSRAKADAAMDALRAAGSVDALTLVEADLLADDGWDDAVDGCDYVLHVASPFFLSEPDDPNEYITPAVEGTRRVIGAAQRAGVKRVVLTSSVAAVTGGHGSGHFGPDDWTDTTADVGAYLLSKTYAEQAAWEMVADGSTELATINPAAVLGPSLGASPDAQSIMMATDMISGKMSMYPDLSIGIVDVRDVAWLHVEAMTHPDAAGKRFIASTREPVPMGTMAAIMRDAGYDKAPKRKAPNLLMKVMSVFDKDLRAMVPLLGTRASLDNTLAIGVLDWEPRPLEDTLLEMAAGLDI